MKNLSLIKSVLFVTISLIIFNIIVASFSLNSLFDLNKKSDFLKQNVIKQILSASNMKIAVIQVQQFLSDISATRGMPGFDDGFKNSEIWANKFKSETSYFKTIIKDNPILLKKVDELDSTFDSFYSTGKQMAAIYIKDGPIAGNKFMEKFDPLAEKMTNDLEEVNKSVITPIEGHFINISDLISKTKNIILTLSIFSLLLSLLFIVLSVKTIRNKTHEFANRLLDGQGKVKISAQNNLSISSILSSSVTEQAAAIQQISATSEEISKMANKNKEHVEVITNSTNHQKDLISNATMKIYNLEKEIHELKNMNQHLILCQQDNSKKLGNIIAIFSELKSRTKVIDDIVFQTKLLSFNASVEASRAGIHGKGFAIVAEEVGKLATQSGEASNTINSIINSSSIDIKKITDEADTTMTEEIKNAQYKLNQIIDYLNQNLKIYKEIESESISSHNMLTEISLATTEQYTGINEISKAMYQIDQSNSANSKISQDANKESIDLNQRALELEEVISEFNQFIG